MRKFSDLLEAPQTIVFTFGRFNPPTTGHEKLINKVASVAGGSPYRVYPSFTTNPKKDPLPHSLKIAYMRKMFSKHRKNIIADKNAKTAIHIAEMLYKEGFKNLIMVVGSDRVKEFSTLLNRYNDAPDRSGKQLFKFDSVKVVSAGERDPDAEGVSGMSASKMRAAAADGDKDAFMTGLPSGFRDGEKLYRDVRKYMGIREERDMGDMTDFETVRDMYLTGKIWNAGDIVEAKGVTGEVVRKGTNYLSFVDEDGKVHKAWLHEITLNERNYKKEYANYHSKPEQIERRSSRNKARRVMGDKTKIGMDVGHKDNDPMNNDPENLRNEDPSKNRREPRLREMDEDVFDMIPWLKKAKNYLFTKTHKKGLNKVALAVATEFAKQQKTNKNPNVMNIIHDIVKNISDVTDRMARDYVNDLVKQGKLPKDLRAEYEPQSETMSFKDFVNQIQINEKLGKNADMGDYIDDFQKSDSPQFKGKSKEKRKDMAIAAYLDKKDKSEGAYGYEKQDPDVKDKKGTQPAKYYKGLSKSTKQKRDAHFKAKKTGPAPGDADAKTKPSVHTKKFKQMYGEDGPCWDTHKQVGMKKKGGRMVPNCVPKNEEPRIPRKKGQPAGSDKHSDLYTDENPKGTIHGLGFKDVETAKASVKKIIGSGKSHAHKIQAAVAMEQRAREMGKTAEAAVYRAYIDKMKKKTKEMQEQAPDTSDAMKRYKAGKAGFTDIAHLKAKGLIKRADGEKKKSPKYEDVCCEECETEALIIKENIYRVGSEAYFQYFVDLRDQFDSGDLYYTGFDKRLMEGDIGKFAIYEGDYVPLDCPMMESEYQGKDVELNKPKAGGPKKYYVYVKDPSTGNIKKVSWGDTTGLKIKLDDKAARKSFAARHKCDQKKDKTKAGYWACNMPRYAKQLGLSGGGNFFW